MCVYGDRKVKLNVKHQACRPVLGCVTRNNAMSNLTHCMPRRGKRFGKYTISATRQVVDHAWTYDCIAGVFSQVRLPSLHVRLLHSVLHALWHTHAIRVSILLRLASNVLHCHAAYALGLRYWAILVGEKQSLQPYNLLAELSDSSSQRVVLGREYLHLLLEVG